MTDPILLHTAPNGVATLTFNRPDTMNALNRAAMRHFAETIRQLERDPALRVLIVTGAGAKAFCSGGDLVELRDQPTEADARAMIDLMGDALLALERLPVPVIAAINGYALGGGSEIALACDLRIVDERARMGFVQINMALTPGWGAGQRLARLVGAPKALELLLDGQPLDAEALLALGLANEMTPHAQALAAAQRRAEAIAERPPQVVRAIKALLHAHRTLPYEAALQAERDLFPPLWAHPDHLQAVEAFFARQARKG
ncbi:MAG: enoyl-CoA hydratase/isomerase family protein [Anaerolineae bacterium]